MTARASRPPWCRHQRSPHVFCARSYHDDDSGGGLFSQLYDLSVFAEYASESGTHFFTWCISRRLWSSAEHRKRPLVDALLRVDDVYRNARSVHSCLLEAVFSTDRHETLVFAGVSHPFYSSDVPSATALLLSLDRILWQDGPAIFYAPIFGSLRFWRSLFS